MYIMYIYIYIHKSRKNKYPQYIFSVITVHQSQQLYVNKSETKAFDSSSYDCLVPRFSKSFFLGWYKPPPEMLVYGRANPTSNLSALGAMAAWKRLPPYGTDGTLAFCVFGAIEEGQHALQMMGLGRSGPFKHVKTTEQHECHLLESWAMQRILGSTLLEHMGQKYCGWHLAIGTEIQSLPFLGDAP